MNVLNVRNAVLGMFFAQISIFAYAAAPLEDEVKGLVTKAAAEIKKNGIDTACKSFASADGSFVKDELYIYVHDLKAKMICHATNAKLNGKDLLEMKDVDGKPFNKEMVELAKAKGNGWLSYKFINPRSQNIETKTSYIQREGEYIVGAGFYKK